MPISNGPNLQFSLFNVLKNIGSTLKEPPKTFQMNRHITLWEFLSSHGYSTMVPMSIIYPGLKEKFHQDLVLIGNSAQVVLSVTYNC